MGNKICISDCHVRNCSDKNKNKPFTCVREMLKSKNITSCIFLVHLWIKEILKTGE